VGRLWGWVGMFGGLRSREIDRGGGNEYQFEFYERK
jgi:hypothetical protein